MTYYLRVEFCDKKAGESKLSESVAYDTWATYADALFQGLEFNAEMQAVSPDKHPVRVSLVWENDLDVKDYIVVSSAFLICECVAKVDSEKRAKSRLYVPSGALTT